MPFDHDLVTIAQEITKWAETKRMINESHVASDYNHQIIQEIFVGTAQQAVISTLVDRQISYIGVNEAEQTIVIYLQKSLRAKDRDALTNFGGHTVRISFQYAGQMTSGSVPPQSIAPPYHLHNGRYTCGSSTSIATYQSAGTIGCLAQDSAGQIFAISNNHVFAGNNYAEIGMPIIVPGNADIQAGGLDPFTIGHLQMAIPLIDGSYKLVNASSNIDAAAISIADPDRVSSMQKGFYDTPSAVLPIEANMRVEKVGRTTGRTTGIARSYHVTAQSIRCYIGSSTTQKVVYFTDFWGVTSDSGAFSLPGDSGSLVTAVDPAGNRSAVGLIFAGSEGLSFMLPLNKVLSQFQLTLISGHNI